MSCFSAALPYCIAVLPLPVIPALSCSGRALPIVSLGTPVVYLAATVYTITGLGGSRMLPSSHQ